MINVPAQDASLDSLGQICPRIIKSPLYPTFFHSNFKANDETSDPITHQKVLTQELLKDESNFSEDKVIQNDFLIPLMKALDFPPAST